jgi:hypothetical protein
LIPVSPGVAFEIAFYGEKAKQNHPVLKGIPRTRNNCTKT